MHTSLSAREAYQLLKDIAMGVRVMTRVGEHCWSTLHCGPIPIDVEGWRLTLFNEGGEPGYCVECSAPDGRSAGVETWGRHGTDPVQLLSRWEREQLERLLKGL